MKGNPLRENPAIIIVDDTQDLIEVYRKFFSVAGLPVLTSFNAGEALLAYFQDLKREMEQKKAAAEYAIVLIDHRMPGLDGIETALRLRKINGHAKIVLTSNDIPPDYAIENDAFDAILEKPFSMQELLSTIERLTNSYEKFDGSKVIEGRVRIHAFLNELLSDCRFKLNLCLNSRTPPSVLGVDDNTLKELATKRPVTSLLIDINRNNFELCKRLASYSFIELRHYSGVETSFLMIDDKHYVELGASSEDSSTAKTIQFSSKRSVVSHKRILFDSLWGKSIPASQRLEDLEKTMEGERTLKILCGEAEMMKNRIDLVSHAKASLDVCYQSSFAPIPTSPELWDAYRSALERGVHIRHLTEVTRENADSVRLLLNRGLEIRHLEGIIGGFAVNEEEAIGTASLENMGGLPEAYNTRCHLIVQQYRWIFSSLWEKAVPADSKLGALSKTSGDGQQIHSTA